MIARSPRRCSTATNVASSVHSTARRQPAGQPHAGLRGGARQRPGEQGQARCRQRRAAPVERDHAARLLGLSDESPGEECRSGCDGRIEEKDRAPADHIDHPPAENGAERARQRADRRPRANRPAPRIAGERAAEDRQAIGHQKRRPQSLQAATDQQPAEGRRGGADDRRQSEQGQSRQEKPPTAEMVAERAAQQDQRAQRQEIGVDRPG